MKHGFISHIEALKKHSDLLRMWTLREIQIRYKQSILGGMWAVLQPLVLMIVFSLVFSYFLDIPSDNIPYPLFSYTAVLPWQLLSAGLSSGIPAVVGNMGLVTKIYFPREILVLGSIAAALVDFMIASIIFAGMMIWYHVPITWNFLWLPAILLVQLMLILGVALPASALNVYYRDIRFIIPLALQLWMYASPVIYPLSLVPDRIKPFYFLNPMVGILEGYRNVLLQSQPPDLIAFGYSLVVSLGLFFFGYWFFKRQEFKFADII